MKSAISPIVLRTRNDLPALFSQMELTNQGVELGVARGRFSEHILSHCGIRRLYSIDSWSGDRGHDISQCLEATIRLSKFGCRSIVIRALFEEAKGAFEDSVLDFAYIDGYAHTGNEAGLTLEQWWAKVRPGGILAGHDYSGKWPQNKIAVDQFREIHKIGEGSFFLTKSDKYPSWVICKK